MNYLLDTHIFLWWLDDNKRLSSRHKQIISSGTNRILLSVATLWEIEIKRAIGKLSIDKKFVSIYQSLGFEELKIGSKHIEQLSNLEPHHKDPFDRILIAQAKTENAVVLTVDKNFKNYPIKTI